MFPHPRSPSSSDGDFVGFVGSVGSGAMFAAGDLRESRHRVYAEKSGRKAGSLITQDWGAIGFDGALFAAGKRAENAGSARG